MKVEIICGTYPPDICGVADYTRSLVRELRKQGIDASVVTTVGRDITADPDVPASDDAPDWTVSGARVLAKKLQIKKTDIVHLQFPAFTYHGRWGANLLPLFVRNRKLPVITTLHEYCMAPWGGRLKQNLNILFSDAVILTNQEDERILTKRLRNKPSFRIPIGSNMDDCGNAEQGKGIVRSLGMNVGAPVFLFFGFVRPGKGIEALLDALFQVNKQAIAQLLIVSPDPEPEYRVSLNRVCKLYGLENKVFWAGYRNVDEVSSLLHYTTAAVLPFEDGATERRGSLLAAITHGIPVVTTHSSTTPEIFQHERNMLLTNSGDADAIAACMLRIVEDQALKANISSGAYRLGELFHWETIARETIAVYNQVLSQRGIKMRDTN